MSDDPYVYPGTRTLKNFFEIREQVELDRIERRLTAQRAREGCPTGNFDLAHLRAIHRHLFQDIYEWAGEIRSLEMSKGGNMFQASAYIETGMADVHARLVSTKFLAGLEAHAFAGEAGAIIGDVNYVHPFREGNCRTQLQYLKQLAERAGHALDLSVIDPETWIRASQLAHRTEYGLMSREIARALDASGS